MTTQVQWPCPCCQDAQVEGFQKYTQVNPFHNLAGMTLILPLCEPCANLPLEEALGKLEPVITSPGSQAIDLYVFESKEGEELVIPDRLRPPPGYSP